MARLHSAPSSGRDLAAMGQSLSRAHSTVSKEGPGLGPGALCRVSEAWKTLHAVPREAVFGVTTTLPVAMPPAGGPLCAEGPLGFRAPK